jgi:hypothetical protein
MFQGSTGFSNRVVQLEFKRRKLQIDVSSDLFQIAFGKFTVAAEEFVLSLTDSLHRKFAQRYFVYLQEIAQGAELSRSNTVSVPAYRLIRNELDRLFERDFVQTLATDHKVAIAA